MIERGSIYLAKLYPSKGNEVGKTRPILVLQSDMLTQAGHTTTIIVPLSTHLIDDAFPLRYRVSKRDKLLHDSDILCDQIRAIDNSRIIPDMIAQLDKDEMVELEQQIELILDFGL